MKNKLLYIFLTCFFTVTVQAQDISGSWSWNSLDGGNMFTIDLLEISKDNYRGHHCSVYLDGDRIDCNDDGEDFSVVLIRKAEDIFQGSIRSGYSNSVGSVQLQYIEEEDIILFTLTTSPKGEYYIPVEARLQR